MRSAPDRSGVSEAGPVMFPSPSPSGRGSRPIWALWYSGLYQGQYRLGRLSRFQPGVYFQKTKFSVPRLQVGKLAQVKTDCEPLALLFGFLRLPSVPGRGQGELLL